MNVFRKLFGGTKDGDRLIHHIANNDWQQLKSDIKAGADVNSKDQHGQTPLMVASACGHSDVVQNLVAAGADVNAKDNKGKTALMHAAGSSGYGGSEIVSILLAAGADMNVENDERRTALKIAKANAPYTSCSKRSAEILENAGATE